MYRGTISATIINPCGSALITKNISTGGQLNSSFTSIVKNTPQGGKVLESSIPYVAGNTYQWKLGGSVIANGATSFVYGPNCSGGPYQTINDLELTVTNACGQTSTQCKKFEFVCSSNTFLDRGPCGGLIEISSVGGDYQYQCYPNPAESELNITRQTRSGPASDLRSPPVKLRLYNAKGEILRSGTISGTGNDIKWNTLDISDGTYFLHTFEKSGTIKKQILIRH